MGILMMNYCYLNVKTDTFPKYKNFGADIKVLKELLQAVLLAKTETSNLSAYLYLSQMYNTVCIKLM